VDLNGDTHLDILSGSYSRMTEDMAGLFQVLYGDGKGGFQKATPVLGKDGEPLILPAVGDDDSAILSKICTRPFAVDLDGDSHLDIVAGNFAGTFYVFRGEGKGAFATTATLLVDAKGQALKVPHHSDPFVIDFDGDGDWDILSGSSDGGVHISINGGSKKASEFAPFRSLIETRAGSDGSMMHRSESVTQDDSHLKGPSSSTRIWVADHNGDGKLDIFVGDQITLMHPAEGIELEDAQAKHAEFMKQRAAISREPQPDNPDEEAMQALMEERFRRVQQLEKELLKSVKRTSTGHVWVYHQI
jgi:hypothetical protein